MNVVASLSIMVMNWSGSASCNCFRDRRWAGRASQPLPNFFPCPQPRLQGFSLKKWVGKSPGDEVALALQLMYKNIFLFISTI